MDYENLLEMKIVSRAPELMQKTIVAEVVASHACN
jgi:hypothetical protein